MKLIIKGSPERISLITSLINEWDKQNDPLYGIKHLANEVGESFKSVLQAAKLGREIQTPSPNYHPGGPAIVGEHGPEIIKGNFAGPMVAETFAQQAGIIGVGGPGTGPGEGHPVGGAEPAKRTRRTKEQILADNEKLDPVNNPPATNGATNELSFDEIKAFAQERAQEPDNVPKIKAKLKEFGVEKTKELDQKHWNSYYVFLQAL